MKKRLHRRRAFGLVAILALVASVAPYGPTAVQPAAAATQVAFDMVGSVSQNLLSQTNPFAGAFASAGDGFEKYQRGVSASIPFAVLDDSLTVFPADSLGIVGEANVDEFFGVVDTTNSDNPSGVVAAEWVFDISGASNLELSIAMGAMGDFEASSDSFEWSYVIDGGTPVVAFASSVDEATSQTYTMDGGATFTLADPMLVGSTLLTNNLQALSVPVSGTGTTLTLTLDAVTDSGSEALAFQDIVISAGGGPSGPVAFDMVGSVSQNLLSQTNPFAGAFASAGDGFEKYQRGVSASIPFAVLDDSLTVFPADSLGIVGEANVDEFFGVVDTTNSDNPSGVVAAEWVFDISGASNLELSIAMGAMGDFEASSDSFEWSYVIDGGTPVVAFASSVDEATSQTYTMDGGATFTLADPMLVGSTLLTNNLQALSVPVSGTGTTLTLTLDAVTDSGSEALAFQDIVISAGGGPSGPVAFDMVGSVSQNLLSQTNPFAGAFASAGDGFEKYQRGVSASIPFAVLDDSLTVFPADSLGIVGEANVDEFFGVVDTTNSDNPSGVVAVEWVFDISGASNLELSIAMGAMGDFEASSDSFEWSYVIDGGTPVVAFASSVDEATSQTYTMDGGATFTLADPMLVGSTLLTNNLQALSVPVSGTGTTLTLTLDAVTDSGSEALAFQDIVISAGGGGPGPVDPDFGVCGDATESLISTIQGVGFTSPEVGVKHVVEAVVVGDFQGTAVELGGFFLQEEDEDADGSEFTSEGLFIHDDGFGIDVNVGDTVRAKGTVAEEGAQTELGAITDLAVCTSLTGTASSATVTLPVADVGDFESYEGMAVDMPQTLFVTDNFTWNRSGEVTLSVDGVLDNPTNVVSPGAAANALQDLNNRSGIQLDDGSRVLSPDLDPPPYIQVDGTLRRGDTIPSLAAVLGQQGPYELHPTESIAFTRVNDRPAPPDVGGSMQVGAFNVLNYFTTIDDSGPICGPDLNQGCRGADTASEFTRQRTKIISAITQLDADVLGLMELENAPDDDPQADLVSGLNDAVGAGTYAYLPTGAIGDDAIRDALIYQPASVTPLLSFALLDSSVDPLFNDDKNRPVLAQSFIENATGEIFTVAVNHLKSKGSSCNDVGDPNAGDGQGNCNGVRTDAAIVQANWLATDPTGSGDPDSIIVGDLNAYAMEDPVAALQSAGYTDLVELFNGPGDYSFVFFGQDGYLDHALTTPRLTSDVTGAMFWHVNADEPSGLDYNEENRQPSLYQPDQFRSSDHDPVVVGLDMANALGLKTKARADLEAMLPTGNKNDDKSINRALDKIDESLDPALWVDEDRVDPQHGHMVFDSEGQAVVQLGQVSSVDVGAISAALADVDGRLARTAIDDATAAGGDAQKLAAAEADFAAGVAAAAAGDYSAAITSFRSAWKNAKAATTRGDVRFGTYNASMNRFNAGDLATELSTPGSAQPATIAEIIQRTRPEVLLINEFDYDAEGLAAELFQENYLGVGQRGAAPIVYPYRYVAPSNTGVPSGFDLDNDGTVGGPNDAFGFGFFEGQFGMVVYSMHPIEYNKIRTFQHFLWKDMPGAMLPDDPATEEPGDWYSEEELGVFRLSSKSHWDVPIRVDGKRVHFLVSHPTPPVFDGPEDRNGTRNHDEIRFWADYVSGAGYIVDDAGKSGGLPGGAVFVVAGDENADPNDGDSVPGAIQQLLDHPRVNTSVTPSSLGGPEQSALQGGINDDHLSDPAHDTADFNEPPGNIRVDYVLPSTNTTIQAAGVFWPLSSDPLFGLVGTFPFPSSDHKLVWIDLDLK